MATCIISGKLKEDHLGQTGRIWDLSLMEAPLNLTPPLWLTTVTGG